LLRKQLTDSYAKLKFEGAITNREKPNGVPFSAGLPGPHCHRAPPGKLEIEDAVTIPSGKGQLRNVLNSARIVTGHRPANWK